MSRLTSSPMTEVSRFRVVLDTNVILAALLSRNPASPTVELLHRWHNGEFALLYCTDLLLEYQEKLITKQIHLERRLGFLSSLIAKGFSVNLVPAEIVPRVLADPDDDDLCWPVL